MTTPMWMIHEKVCDHFKVELGFPFTVSKSRDVVYLRQVFQYLTRTLNPKVSFAKIGMFYGDIGKVYNYATVIHNCNLINDLIDVDKAVRNDVEQILKKIEDEQ